MICLRAGAGLLAGVLAVAAAAASAQTAPSPKSAGNELDALIAAGQFERAEGLVRQRLASGADPAAEYFKIGEACFNHQAWQRSAGFLQKSLALKPANDEARRYLGLDWRELHRPSDAEAELMEAARRNPGSGADAYFAGQQLIL
ncbi:MAG TPA: hypothetical protein VJO16_01540, partial [Candidatus Acidoferrum sp.]|nr:hypothetical protein [Candidatus Acidoferrum sp.]